MASKQVLPATLQFCEFILPPLMLTIRKGIGILIVKLEGKRRRCSSAPVKGAGIY
jgi:hypothetical protein